MLLNKLTDKTLYDFLLFDADGTLLDFDRCEYVALGKTFEALGVPYDKQTHALFNSINKALWHDLDEGKISRDRLLLQRFETVFNKLGVTLISSEKAEKVYRQNLNEVHFVFDGVFELLDYLKKRYRLFIVTNGVKHTQDKRLMESGLTPFFENIFISDEIGFIKPKKEFFDIAFARIDNFDSSRALVVGDSLTSDIMGAQNAGVDACWINRDRSQNIKNLKIKYEFDDVCALREIL